MTAAAARGRGWGGPARVAIVVLIIVAILFLFVFPTRSFLEQRGRVNDARHDVEVMREQNERLADEAEPAEDARGDRADRARAVPLRVPG